MFTREEIINELEKKGIKISKRTFDYYREMNLIPPPEKIGLVYTQRKLYHL